MNQSAKKITTYALFCALAFVVVALIRIPLVLFLKFEPKDVVITIGGFLYGPIATVIISVVVAFVEMITISSDGVIGFVMNVISAVAFAGTASIIYKRKSTMTGAAIGLGLGTVLMTVLMLLWNYFLAPIFMGFPREDVVKLLVPAFLPFNLIKGGINAALTLLLYKPIINILRKASVVPDVESIAEEGTAKKTGVIILALFVLASCILMVLSLRGII
ncbi:hypothetical protein Cpap_2423 [Ruminiclostridium papyrosolvens DSM 2782]|uniref:Riboflavin transporter n=1 Tax=Ruminiclostridium papyrosolvens DSM 2782 TaxID=588581 RepID=F1TB69_9FIRM|nr:ECF transporter S component [Ruminiclostridium papyrosolvens]EGD48273.1 hypothetical protein Cpap_2423 [Ruminiclostridium papyrosolvens DSM 2782]WES34220.1 ECF transporter S component [Ruminiclostridium papyrosolvens DSM 2782]